MFEELKNKLYGCFHTVFTPFNEEHQVDYETFDKYLETLYQQGATKFYVMAYNSRYSQLKHEEIMSLNGFCIKKVKSLSTNNIVIVGDPIHCSTAETIEFTAHAKECGGDLVSLIVREKHFFDEQILEHYSMVGDATNMPILVHEMPFLSGYDGKQIHWPNSLIDRLVDIPQIIALKEDAKDFDVTCHALKLEPRIRVIIAGRKSSFMPFKEYGAKAYLNGISIMDASIGELFWKSYLQNDSDTIKFIMEKLEAPFFDNCVSKYGWHRTNKALLQAAGLMHRRDRMPLKHLSDIEYQEIELVYSEVLEAWNKFK